VKRDKVRIAVLNTHPIQYLAPLYAYLNAVPDLSVTVLYMSDVSIRGARDREFGIDVKWDIDLLSGYPYRFLGEAAHRRTLGGLFSLIAPQAWNEIRSGKYDVLWVNGHNYAGYLLGIAAAKSAGLPVMMRCETHLRMQRGLTKATLRKPIMRTFYHFIDRFLAIGSANASFLRAMSVPSDKIFPVPYTIDNDRFSRSARTDSSQRDQLRRSFGIADNLPVVLFAAKFQKRKRADDLIRAAAVLQAAGIEFHLMLVGSGEQEARLKAMSAELELARVSFPGFANQSVLPDLYAACDVFVLPSDNETWGLTVNEAMCAGLPIVASAEIGCADDLVKNGVNGHSFETGDIEGLAGALRPILCDPSLRKRMSTASRELISHWSHKECLDGVRAAVAGLPRHGIQGGGDLRRSTQQVDP